MLAMSDSRRKLAISFLLTTNSEPKEEEEEEEEEEEVDAAVVTHATAAQLGGPSKPAILPGAASRIPPSPVAPPRYECSTCHRRFTFKAQMVYHELSHGRDRHRLHICNDCEMAFPKRCSLQNHIKCVHESERRFHCDQCERSFFLKKDLTKHVSAVHQGLRSHPCELCKRSFSKPDHLKRHKRLVHGQG